MRRPIAIALLALGTIGGYASGFASLARGGCRWSERRYAYEERLAERCATAALQAQARLSPPPAAAPAAPAPATAPVQVAPVVIVPPIQMVTPMAPAPAQVAPAPAQAAPAPAPTAQPDIRAAPTTGASTGQ